MDWKDILKIKINSLSDASRVARDYVPEDYIEGHLLTQEEYDKLSNEEKRKYHKKVYNKYANLNLNNRREAKWHNNNAGRIKTDIGNAILKPHPTEEEDFKPAPTGFPAKPNSYKNILQGSGRRLYGPYRLRTAKAHGYRVPRKPQRKRGPKRKRGAKKGSKHESTKLREKRQNEKINQIIVDYFKIYNSRFGRNPTLQEIANEEDRPLTVDEIESFKRYAQGR